MNNPDNLTSFLNYIDHPSKYDPRSLKKQRVKLDPKIKDSIYKINSSGWLWTIWSCQGHLLGREKGSIPYFTFIVDKKYLDRLFYIIHLSFPKEANLKFPIYSNGFWYGISQGVEDDIYCVISWHLYFSQGKVGLDKIQKCMIQFADSIEVLDVKK
jgi:hypothetical protein